MIQVGDSIYCTLCTIIEFQYQVGVVTYVDEKSSTLKYKVRFRDSNLTFWGNGFKASQLLQALI